MQLFTRTSQDKTFTYVSCPLCGSARVRLTDHSTEKRDAGRDGAGAIFQNATVQLTCECAHGHVFCCTLETAMDRIVGGPVLRVEVK